VAGALEALGHHALVLAAGAGLFGGEDFGMRGHEAADELRVLVVHEGNLLGAEEAGFFNIGWGWNWHRVGVKGVRGVREVGG